MPQHLVKFLGLAPLVLLGMVPPQVGSSNRDGILVPSGQRVKPVGRSVQIGRRPVDFVLSPDAKTAYVKDNHGLTLIALDSMTAVGDLATEGGSSTTGIALSADGKTIYLTNAGNALKVIDVSVSPPKLVRSILIPPARVKGQPYPCGVALDEVHNRVFVALNRDNSVAVIDLTGALPIRTIDTAIAPFGVALSPDGKTLAVSCWSTLPKSGDVTSPSSGTQVPVDNRGIGTGGAVTLVAPDGDAKRTDVPVESQPCQLRFAGSDLWVASANSDTLDRIDLTSRAVKQRIALAPDAPGLAPSAFALSSDGAKAFVACGTKNSILKVDLASGKIEGEVPTAWYPLAITVSGSDLIVACSKGVGSRADQPDRYGHSDYDFTGTLTSLPLTARFAAYRGVTQPVQDPTAPARVVPLAVGEPSLIKHVVYVIKENRTYDQVLGDIGKGDSDPKLTTFGAKVTPNHHALANEFVLLDNYYCNGVLSADGHAWATEGYASTFFERSFGGWTRSYPFGGDEPLAPSTGGYIWDDALDHGKTFRNFGEGDYALNATGQGFAGVYKAWMAGKVPTFGQSIAIARLRAQSCRDFPGWNLTIPDGIRADAFLREFKQMEANGTMPDLTIVYLPCDHTSGTGAGSPTPRAQVADNDLALGRIVEGISKSKFWADTCIFVNEDDPQAGFDHVDGHRSLCLVVSPYSKRGAVVSDFYNQTSVVRTIEHMLGLPPMNRMDAAATLMTGCFRSKPDLTPYTVKANQIPLDEMNPSWVSMTKRLDFSKPDLNNEDTLNRQIWASVFPSRPYPRRFAGAHARGLAGKGLRLEGGTPKKDDD